MVPLPRLPRRSVVVSLFRGQWMLVRPVMAEFVEGFLLGIVLTMIVVAAIRHL